MSLPPSSFEWIDRPAVPTAARLVIFDFDGTLSLIRGGWMDIMLAQMHGHLGGLLREGEAREALETLVLDSVMGLNGKPTIFQMQWLAEEIAGRGGTAEPDEYYLREFLDGLRMKIDERSAVIKADPARAVDYLVPGAIPFMESLQARGIAMALVSGTELEAIVVESKLLGIDRFFNGHIYGPGAVPTDFSKPVVMERLVREHGVEPAEMVAFGDGVTEIRAARQLGGLAIAVASDEAHPGRLDPRKRDLLIAAGAQAIIPDYRHPAAVTAVGAEPRREGA